MSKTNFDYPNYTYMGCVAFDNFESLKCFGEEDSCGHIDGCGTPCIVINTVKGDGSIEIYFDAFPIFHTNNRTGFVKSTYELLNALLKVANY